MSCSLSVSHELMQGLLIFVLHVVRHEKVYGNIKSKLPNIRKRVRSEVYCMSHYSISRCIIVLYNIPSLDHMNYCEQFYQYGLMHAHGKAQNCFSWDHIKYNYVYYLYKLLHIIGCSMCACNDNVYTCTGDSDYWRHKWFSYRLVKVWALQVFV